MSKPANNPAEPSAEASVLRAIHSLAEALQKVPQDALDKWAAESLKDYIALATALARLAELTQTGAAKGEIITAEALTQIEKRLNLGL